MPICIFIIESPYLLLAKKKASLPERTFKTDDLEH